MATNIINGLIRSMTTFVTFLMDTQLVPGVTFGAFIVAVLVLHVIARALWR